MHAVLEACFVCLSARVLQLPSEAWWLEQLTTVIAVT